MAEGKLARVGEQLVAAAPHHTVKELAEMFGISSTTVRSHCWRYRVQFLFQCHSCGRKKHRDDCVNSKRCKECDKAIRTGEGTKMCRECGETKPIDEFYLNGNKRSRRHECRQCMSESGFTARIRRSGFSDLPIPSSPGRVCYYGQQWRGE
jgi:hypothetical protein